MTATYQELLKKSYVQRLRNQKDGNSILLILDDLVEDYTSELNTQAALSSLNANLTAVL